MCFFADENLLNLEIKMKQNVIVSLNPMYYTVFSTIHQMYLAFLNFFTKCFYILPYLDTWYWM